MRDRPHPFSSIRTLFAGTTVALALLGWGLLGPVAHAQHPTAVTSIVNSAQDTTLEVNYTGSLLMPGDINFSAPNDSIPASGAGTRMMWYPAKAAFRAGEVGRIKNSDGWNAANVGKWSVAFGRDTEATGLGAAAIGDRVTSNADYAVAMGIGTSADGQGATAIGQFSTASGVGATAIGDGTTAATNHSHSIGECNDKNRGNDDNNANTGPLFVVGSGDFGTISCDSRSDALVLDKSGNLTTAGTVNGSSDRRLKTDIQPLSDDILKRLADLRPVRYKFKNQDTHPSGEQIGLVAQDVQKEFPQFVKKGSDGYLSLAYARLTAVLLKGIQEQQAQLEKKDETIAELKANQEQIEKRLATLEAERSSTRAGWSGSSAGLTLAFLLGGLFGAGLLWRRRD